MADKKKKGRGRYSDRYCTFQDGTVVTDRQIARMVKKHTRWWDRLDYHFICDCAQTAFDILSEAIDEPKKRNWRFGKDI